MTANINEIIAKHPLYFWHVIQAQVIKAFHCFIVTHISPYSRLIVPARTSVCSGRGRTGRGYGSGAPRRNEKPIG
jgi:hypothetical protein